MEQKSTWARLRWPVKAVIIAIPIIGIGYWAFESGKLDAVAGKPETTKTDSGWAAESGTKPQPSKATKATEDRRTFNYSPEKPVDGEMKGVVEVGASGFNSFVVNIDKDKHWEIVSKDFGKSFVYEGMATTADIRMGLKDYIGAMFDKGVKSRNVHFVISSGAQKDPKTATISAELKKMGYVVNLVTAEQEGKLALKCVLPPTYAENSFVVDIGSGNTKISWMEGNSIKSLEGPGAKYYEKEMKDDAVYAQIKALAEKIPATKREICFIIGGVPFELAKQIRDGEERFTVLNEPAKYQSDKVKIKSGLNIYNAIKATTNCDTFVFDWDANFTIGFLLSLK
ncbi:hypothetical protein [Chitinophaga nivalis]|uniref:Ppx/GppA phosphatase domain-containing protein n=1 Tax=Chitinophaga nivalis TaxID=2991709 RepID=A0ABT3IKD8_9BACT|nr:hypothetical protein [Chitinophaga nivalis]MCW3465883.1 hypothetical protein [Chitinophaga nivalis]MCW3484426.1 hypothetical protein [Chitinophaga nivalis]